MRASDLTDAEATTAAHVGGVYRWRDRPHLNALLEGWPVKETDADLSVRTFPDSLWRELGADERRVVVHLAERLLKGQRQYGRIDLASDPRDFTRERREEIEDLLVYSAFAALRAGR